MPKYTQAAVTTAILACVSFTSPIHQTWAWIPNFHSNGNSNIRFSSLSSSSSSSPPSTTQLYAWQNLFSTQPPDIPESIPTPTTDTTTATTATDLLASTTSSSSSFQVPSSIESKLYQFLQTEKATEEAITNVEKATEEAIINVEKSSATNILNIFDSIDSLFSSMTSSLSPLQQQVHVPTEEEISKIILKAMEVAIANSQPLDEIVLANPALRPVISFLQEKILSISPIIGKQLSSTFASYDSLGPSVTLVTSAIVTYTITSNILSMSENNNLPPSSSPYPLGRYDPNSARAYFDRRLNEVIGRGFEIASQSSIFGFSLLNDKLNNQWEENSEQRGMELAELLTRLGPTFIKIGQSLSIRTDLLSPAYVRGLKSLQDQVPPFDTTIAKQIIEDELGLDSIRDMFVEFSNEPVAAASLGQVYKARLKPVNGEKEGKEVAIKVQRPNIMNQIALDMHFLRELAPWVKRTFNLNTDAVGTVDAWGVGFVDELDYISEAENAEYFTESIQSTPLASVVFSPPVIEECTTGKVLTTEWVVGERLDKSSNEDVTVLCSIAMNTYLTMMLETGVLHCDPHPGNLLRTPEGQLCILDWGMVTRLDPDLQITLIEHMAHLTSADYAEIPRDLLLLGFIPEEKSHLIDDSGIVEVLADIYGAWTKGGGAASINVNQVVAQLQDLTAKKGNLFQIPPYFAYIAKSFSVLEGIGLSNDAKYSIINECLPYVSKRLLTDRSERTGGALSTFIFGPSKNDESRIIDYDRVEQLISGFGDYTTSSSGASLGQEKTRSELIDDLVDQVLDLVATEEETPLQTIFIEQLAKIISASGRSVWSEIRERSGKLPSGRTVLGTIVDPFGLFRTSPVIRMNTLDQQTIDNTRNLIQLLSEQAEKRGDQTFSTSDLSNAEIQEISSKLVRKIWQKRTRIARTGGRLATKLLQLTADKLESGEREVFFLPSESTTDTASKNENDGKISENAHTEQSDRLKNARRILEEAEAEAEAESNVL